MAAEAFVQVDRAGAAEAIRRMNEEDLRYLNRLIVERLKLIGQAHGTSRAMLARFGVGDRGELSRHHSGDRKAGVIIRLNKKAASIATDDGQHWNVHPGFLIPRWSWRHGATRGRHGWGG